MSSIARTPREVAQRSRLPAFLMFAGAPLIVFLLTYLHAHVVAVPSYTIGESGEGGWIAIYSGLIVVASYAVGLPEEPRTLLSAAGRALAAGGLAAAAISFFGLFTASNLLPRFTVFATIVLLVPLAVVSNWTVGTAALRGSPTRVFVVGTDAEVAAMRASMARDLERPAQIVGNMTVAQAQADRVAEVNPLFLAATAAEAAMLVVSTAGLANERVVHRVAEMHEGGVRVRSLADFYQDWMGKLLDAEVERASLLFDIGELHGPGYARAKRIVDVIGSLVMVLPLAALTPLVWLGNLVGNRGPLFYRQPRVGRNGEVFRIWKFRTMTPNSDVSTWTTADDPRITPFGGFLRRSHLDELPQAINVLRGELSLVGPRPEQPDYVAQLVQRLPYYGLRHVVRPGLTGWAQVKYPYGASHADAFEKLQFDFFYLRHQGLSMDLRCIARTLRTVTGATGR